MHESLTTSSLLTKLKQESPLEVSTCGELQNTIKGTPWHSFDTIKPWWSRPTNLGHFIHFIGSRNTTITATSPPATPPSHQQHHHTIHPAHELSNRAGFITTSTTTGTKLARPRPNGYLVELGTRSSS
jgi:hypothetical protein